MITSHHSFSTRIFLQETARPTGAPAATEGQKQENLREFWWFLRGSRANPPANNRDTQRAAHPAPADKRHA